ncbi:MAG: 3-demethylubiquinone-9 3-methyltransferase [Bacteroidetes bacterium]|jgi:predicted 3-demethylubiquinone-9 3-methyltransferase (glyoxalase superfamily)|nr:3-demethylubiquinone-9 3-methyltransferase [Bacteroidota bacterium]
MKLQKITPFLWFEKGGEDAAKFYTTVFKNSKIITSNPMVTSFELEGLNISILNGGPHFKLSEAFSLCISCDSQEEIDYYWNTFTADGGQESMCGWLKDKFGVSWQVIPSILPQLMSDPQKGPRVIEAFMKMKKFDIETLKNA